MQVNSARGLVVLGILLWTLLAGSQAVGKPAVSAAVQRAETMPITGDLNVVEQVLTAAYRQSPSVELLFQLGRLAAAQDQLLLAQDLMRRYLNDPAASLEPAKVTEAQKVLARPRPPSGKIRVQGDRGGLVMLDGRLLGRLPLVQPLLAAPGPRSVAIQYPGRQLAVQVEVVAGRMIDIQCTRATGAIFLATPPALLVIAELPEIPSALGEQLLDAVERAAQGRQLTLLKPEALLTLDPELKNLPEPKAQAELKQCLGQPECVQRLLHRGKLDYALRIHVKAAEGATENQVPNQAPKQWDFSAELLHVSILAAASAQSQHCAACTELKAATTLQETVSRTLAAGLTRLRGTLVVTSEPAGAQVWIGDRLLGQAPLSLATWVGVYTLDLRQPGRGSVRRTIGVEANKTAEVAATLPAIATPAETSDALPPTPPITPTPTVLPPVASPPVARHWERGPRPRWRLALGATSVLVGVSVTLLGALTMRISADSFCPLVYDLTRPPPGCDTLRITAQRNVGIGTIAVGGVFLVTGVGLLFWPGPRQLVP